MKKLFLFVCFFSSMVIYGQNKDLNRKIEGSWSGKLRAQGIELRLVINISADKNDSLLVTIDSPDQGAKDLPCSKVRIGTDSILIESKRVAGSYLGRFNPEFTTLSGIWRQSGLIFPLILQKSRGKTSLNRPQEPLPPYPYDTLEVTFRNNKDKINLSGTISLPKSGKIKAAVILITGSGPQNRDEALLGHKPFLVLADYLTRNGIAVLRYDDRGIGKSEGNFAIATSFDFANDAESAFDFMKTRKEFDSCRLGLIGHSEGGLIAPIVASRREDVDFIVMMAGPGLTGEQILLLQSALISKAAGEDEKTIKTSQKFSREIYSVLKKYPDNEIASGKIRTLIADFDKKQINDTAYKPSSETEIKLQIQSMISPWFRCFLTFNPLDYLTKLHCAVLAINGSLDLQVPPGENLQAIEKAMIFGGNVNYHIEEVPGLNHLFQTAKTGAPTEYASIEETMSPVVLRIIADWITAQ